MARNPMVTRMYAEYRRNKFTDPQNARRYQKPEKQVLVKHISTALGIWWSLQPRGYAAMEPSNHYRQEIDDRYGY